jgi:hypothetical protein
MIKPYSIMHASSNLPSLRLTISAPGFYRSRQDGGALTSRRQKRERVLIHEIRAYEAAAAATAASKTDRPLLKNRTISVLSPAIAGVPLS